MKEFQELCGVLHLHTPYSDGNSSYRQYAEMAKELNLDFLGVTDHMTLEALDKEVKHREGVIFLIGYEHNDEANHNHCLVFNASKIVQGKTPEEYLGNIARMGGYVILAHPEESRDYFPQFPALPWTAWEDERFQAIELWNQFSIWVENLKSPLSIINLFFPRRLVKEVTPSLKQRWDELNLERFVAGVGGVDAHCLKQKLLFWEKEIFPLKVELKGIRQHYYIQSESPDIPIGTKEELLQVAMITGCGFTSNLRRGDARGSKFYFRDTNGDIQLPGIPTTRKEVQGVLCAEVPSRATFCIYRNGKKIATYPHVVSCEHPVETSGTYRIEVRKNSYGWIYSNHIPLGSYPFHD